MNELREMLDEAYPDAEDEVPEEKGEAPEEVSEGVGEEPEAEGEAPPEAVADAPATDEPDAAPQPVEEPKTPVGWEAEVWGSVPEAAREHITKREQEVERVLRTTVEARKAYQTVGQLTQKYGSVMASEGYNDPIAAFEALMGTVAQLRMGSAQQRADIIAYMVNSYGVDIATLDDALVGNAPAPEVQQQAQMEQMLDQRLAPVNQMMGNLAQMQQQKQMQAAQSVGEEVEAFGKQAEFIDLVRNDMADMMDMATARGQQMTLQEAYDKACQINPQVGEAMRQRLAQKQKAASSVAGHGQGNTKPKEPDSLHDQLVAAWDDFS